MQSCLRGEHFTIRLCNRLFGKANQDSTVAATGHDFVLRDAMEIQRMYGIDFSAAFSFDKDAYWLLRDERIWDAGIPLDLLLKSEANRKVSFKQGG